MTRAKPDWILIRADYEAGGGSLRDLAAKYGVCERTIERHSSKESWVKNVGKVSEKCREHIVTAKVQATLSRLDLIDETIQKCYKAAQELDFKSAGEAVSALDKMLKYDDEFMHQWLLKKGYVALPIPELEASTDEPND